MTNLKLKYFDKICNYNYFNSCIKKLLDNNVLTLDYKSLRQLKDRPTVGFRLICFFITQGFKINILGFNLIDKNYHRNYNNLLSSELNNYLKYNNAHYYKLERDLMLKFNCENILNCIENLDEKKIKSRYEKILKDILI